MIEIDWLSVDCIVDKRRTDQKQQNNHRDAYAMDSLRADRIGAAAEAAFAQKYNLNSPDSQPGGDNGVDYSVVCNDTQQSIQIKATEYESPKLMVSDEYAESTIDRYVLATVYWPKSVEFHGWIESDRITEIGTREPSQFGGMMWTVPCSELDELPEEL